MRSRPPAGRRGNFKIDRLPVGPIVITVRHIGFNRLDDHIDVADGGTYLEQYVVEEWPVTLDKVTVNATTKKWISPGLIEFEDRRKSHVGGYFLGDEELRATRERISRSAEHGRRGRAADRWYGINYYLWPMNTPGLCSLV